MIAIASDHGGYTLKEHIKDYLAGKGIQCQDFGTDSLASCDYPIFGRAAAEAVASGACEKGIGQEFDFNGELLSTCLTAKVIDPKSCRE